MNDPNYETLPVPLTETEVRIKGEELAALERCIADIEAEKSAAAKRLGDAVKEGRAKALEIAQMIESREELRPVQVVEHPDFGRQVVDLVRVDTGVVIRSRPMTERDRQVSLLDSGSGGKVRKARADRQIRDEDDEEVVGFS